MPTNSRIPIVDQYALQGIQLISANLLRAVRNGGDAEARAAPCAGQSLRRLVPGPGEHGGGACAGLSARRPVPHRARRFQCRAAAERPAVQFFRRARTLRGSGGGARRGTQRLRVEHGRTRCRTACGTVPGLRRAATTCPDFDIPRDAIPDLARAAMQITRLLKNNLRPLTEADAVTHLRGDVLKWEMK